MELVYKFLRNDQVDTNGIKYRVYQWGICKALDIVGKENCCYLQTFKDLSILLRGNMYSLDVLIKGWDFHDRNQIQFPLINYNAKSLIKTYIKEVVYNNWSLIQNEKMVKESIKYDYNIYSKNSSDIQFDTFYAAYKLGLSYVSIDDSCGMRCYDWITKVHE